MNIKVLDQSSTFILKDEQFVCPHRSISLEKACCSKLNTGTSGYIECGCGGQDYITCDNPRCTGIKDNEIDELFERLNSISYEAHDCEN